MSDTIEIVEITDSSINPISLELDDVNASLQNTTKAKRQLSDTELDDERTSKKICTDPEDIVAPELLITVSYNVKIPFKECVMFNFYLYFIFRKSKA